MQIGREVCANRGPIAELVGMDVDDGSGAIVRRTTSVNSQGGCAQKTLPCIHEWQGYQSVDA
jgi:hypothetical protein